VNRGAEIALYAMMLVLPLSALLARRIPLGQTVKMALAWVAVFAIGLVIVGQRDRIAPIWNDTRDALLGRDQTVVGDTVLIRMAADGHFWADVSINGTRRRMLIDSGATSTAISGATARAAGLDIDSSPFPVELNTANGQVIARRSAVARLELGGIVARDLPVVVADEFGETDVIGMNFLSRLSAWRVEGSTLILDPQKPM